MLRKTHLIPALTALSVLLLLLIGSRPWLQALCYLKTRGNLNIPTPQKPSPSQCPERSLAPAAPWRTPGST